MSITAAALSQYLSINSQYNDAVRKLSLWNLLKDSNEIKLQKQTKYQELWQKAYDDAQDIDKKCTIGNVTFKEKGIALNNSQAEEYANEKVTQYDEDLFDELSDFDDECESMTAALDVLCQELQAEKDSYKTLVSNNAQQTDTLNT